GALPAPPPNAGVPASRIRDEIGFIPRLDGGRVSGLVVRSQGTGELFRRTGLREGDVVTSIGGRPVGDVADLDRVASDFKGGGSIPILVERGGQPVPLSLQVAPQP
uniref:PDZ domain-containing protein n=1 Tax=Sphingomonas bacterium TaxID=1895847 RepID=UPI001C2CD7E0